MNRQMKLYKEHYHSKNKEEAFKWFSWVRIRARKMIVT